MSTKQRDIVADCGSHRKESTVQFLTPEEAWETFDEAARYYLHLSGQAYVDA